MLSHLLEYCLFLMGRALSDVQSAGRGGSFGIGWWFPSEEELDRTTDDIFGGPLSTRLIRWGRPSVDSMTALLDNGSFA